LSRGAGLRRRGRKYNENRVFAIKEPQRLGIIYHYLNRLPDKFVTPGINEFCYSDQRIEVALSTELQRREHGKGQMWLQNAPEAKERAKSYP
jgi:hypothetical protein